MEIEFNGKMIFWRGPSPLYFVAVPAKQSRELKAISQLATYGWGVIPVHVRIGNTEFTTSLFPKNDKYLEPLKTTVRKAENLEKGDNVTVRLKGSFIGENIMEITPIFGFFASITGTVYVVGGFIVNSYLERYGVTEYQVLRAKYLAVGIIYTLHLVAAVLYAVILAIFGLFFLFFSSTFAASFESVILFMLLLWSTGLLYLTIAKKPLILRFRNKVLMGIRTSFILFTGLLLLFPFLNFLAGAIKLADTIPADQYVLTFISFMIILCTTIYYGRFVYAVDEESFGRKSLVGQGVPAKVKFVVDMEYKNSFSGLGVTVSRQGITNDLLLIDETDQVYIVGIQTGAKVRAVKIDKKIIKIVQYEQGFS